MEFSFGDVVIARGIQCMVLGSPLVSGEIQDVQPYPYDDDEPDLALRPGQIIVIQLTNSEIAPIGYIDGHTPSSLTKEA